MTPDLKTFVKTYVSIGIAISLLALYQTQQQTQALLKIRTRYKWVVVMGVFAINIIVGVVLLLRSRRANPSWQKFDIDLKSIVWKAVGVLLLLLAFPLLWYAKFTFFGRALPAFFPLLWVLWWLVLLQALGLKMISRPSWAVAFALALVLDGVVFQAWNVLQAVTDYPFSVGWSEASRFYYGSLVFSRSLYGVQLPLSIWHATRYFLLSIPFLINGLPLWADRLWQALLWLGLTGLTSWLVVRRLRPGSLAAALILMGWFFLFLFQGAVYYHLQVCVIIILVGVSPRHPWRSLVAVLLASFWAGMSRLNWYPVPAMLAITLYLLDVPYSAFGNVWRYIARPALWAFLGLVAALVGQAFYILVSGNTDVRAFGSSLTSPLLWYRWLPNDTNPLGIVPGILLVSLPLFVLIFMALRGRWSELHLLRRLGLIAMLLILFVGGLVVSTKIGGGGDLHNMDAYMVMLALLAAWLFTQQVELEYVSSAVLGKVAWPVLACMLLVPVAFSLSHVTLPIQYDRQQAAKDLAALRSSVQSYAASGPVLFIYERHLQTFGSIPNVALVPDYEVVTLTEMAISGNQPYLDRFYHDLKTHRFAAIVARKQNLDAASSDFPEESSVWNRLVAYPLLCEYEPVLTVTSSNIQVFIPRPVPQCPPTTSLSGQP